MSREIIFCCRQCVLLMFTIVLLPISLILSKFWRSYNVELETKKLESANEVGQKNEKHSALDLDHPVTLVLVLSLYLNRVAQKVESKSELGRALTFFDEPPE